MDNLGINGKTVKHGNVKVREGLPGDASLYYLRIEFMDGTVLEMNDTEIGVDFSKSNEGRTEDGNFDVLQSVWRSNGSKN